MTHYPKFFLNKGITLALWVMYGLRGKVGLIVRHGKILYSNLCQKIQARVSASSSSTISLPSRSVFKKRFSKVRLGWGGMGEVDIEKKVKIELIISWPFLPYLVNA